MTCTRSLLVACPRTLRPILLRIPSYALRDPPTPYPAMLPTHTPLWCVCLSVHRDGVDRVCVCVVITVCLCAHGVDGGCSHCGVAARALTSSTTAALSRCLPPSPPSLSALPLLSLLPLLPLLLPLFLSSLTSLSHPFPPLAFCPSPPSLPPSLLPLPFRLSPLLTPSSPAHATHPSSPLYSLTSLLRSKSRRVAGPTVLSAAASSTPYSRYPASYLVNRVPSLHTAGYLADTKGSEHVGFAWKGEQASEGSDLRRAKRAGHSAVEK
eukprot:2470274-Rhodomonas_salina.1